jgi:peptidoglycan/xylan/chitin deacetylase (PgdA/CDA1 family)
VRAITLEYHDVVRGDAWDASGFPGPAAASYKVLREDFAAHLRAIGAVVPSRATVHDLGGRGTHEMPVLLTFDDGGRSAHADIAGLLEESGWRGHFFVPTDYIGRPEFLTAVQIRDLRRRGHVIGSHSCSHPLRMARCGWADLVREWAVSAAVLADILGEPVTVASVPGGELSTQVAEAAAQAGIRLLFTSEPVTRASVVADCSLLGRFTVRSTTPASVAARLAGGRLVPRARQFALWNAKSLLKRWTGPLYPWVRELLLDRQPAGADDA